MRTEQTARGSKQNDDEQHEHGDRGEDAADQEIGGLLEQPERKAANDRAAIIAQTTERDWYEAVEIEQRPVGHEGEQQLATGKSSEPTDRPGQRIACHAQVAFRQSQRTRGEIVLGDGKKRQTGERTPIKQLERANCHRAGEHRQPELLVQNASATDAEYARKRLRLRAPFNRHHLLNHQRECKR